MSSKFDMVTGKSDIVTDLTDIFCTAVTILARGSR